MGGTRIVQNDQTQLPSPQRRKAIFGRLKTVTALVLGAVTWTSGTNINDLGGNIAMASRHIDPAVLEATKAVDALKVFLLTGNSTKKDDFLRIFNAGTSGAFLTAFGSDLRTKILGDAKLGPVLLAFKAVEGGRTDLVKFVDVIGRAYDAVNANDIRTIDRIRTDYSDAMVSNVVIPFLKAMEKDDFLRLMIPRRQDKMESVSDKTLEAFAKDYGINLTGITGREDRIERIGGHIRDEFFLTDDNVARALTKTLLQAYALLEKDEKPAFFQWLGEMDHRAKAGLLMTIGAFGPGAKVEAEESTPGVKNYKVTQVRGIAIPHMAWAAVKDMFKVWNVEQARLGLVESEKERLLRSGYPAFIRQTSATDLAAVFERQPTGQGYDNIEIRVGYLNAEREIRVEQRKTARIAEIDKELAAIEKWFDGFGLDLGGRDNTLINKLDVFKKGLWGLQQAYWTMREGNYGVITSLNLSSSNKKLYDIYMSYIFHLDKNTLGIFQKIDRKSENILAQMRDAITNIKDEKVLLGNQAWSTIYYPNGSLPAAATRRDPRIADDYRRAATLDPTTYFVFANYVQTVEDNLVGSPEEKRLVAQTVARLYALNPALAIKYLKAVTNLAKICRDQRETFELALIKLAAKIDMRSSGLNSGVSPTSMLPINTRRVINDLNSAFEELMGLDVGEFSRYDRYPLLDDAVLINPNAPHDITHRPPAWKYPLTPPYDSALSMSPPYFLPSTLNPLPYVPQLLNTGALFNNYDDASGQINLPRFSFLDVDGQTRAVGDAFRLFVDEKVGLFGVPTFIPGSQIVKLSPTKLMGQIDRAFISKVMEPYTFDVAGRGGALGGRVGKATPEGTYSGMVGGLGSILTSEGGVSAGGSVDVAEANQYFAGMTAIATPIGFVEDLPLVGGAFKGEGDQPAGLQHGSIGYQKLSDGAQRALGQALIKAGYPSNPRELGIAVNYEETAEGKTWSNTKYFWVDKQGTIFELEGGTNNFVQMLNYLSAYGDNPAFGTGHPQPITYAANVEPTMGSQNPDMKRGGAVVVWDMGKSAGLAHFQAVPLLANEVGPQLFALEQDIAAKEVQIAERDTAIAEAETARHTAMGELADANASGNAEAIAIAEAKVAGAESHVTGLQEGRGTMSDELGQLRQDRSNLAQGNGPLLLEWTPGFAHTVEDKSGANVYVVTAPGELLFIRPDEEHKTDLYIQDLVLRYRRVNNDQTAWEIVAGAGLGAVVKEAPGTEKDKNWIGRGGVLYKWEDRSKRPGWKSGGAGVYYEGAVTDLETTAVVSSLDGAEEMRREIESLHRIGVTLYGSGQLANRVLLGALGNYVAEFTSSDYKDSFFRFIGFVSGLEEINGRTRGTAAKVDYQRERGLMGRIQQDYRNLARDVNQNPDQADTLISNFRNQYEQELMQIFDRYYLGVQVNEDASLQFSLVSREKENEWTQQKVDTAYGKFLYDWGSVFARAYVSMPLWAMQGFDSTAGTQQHGLIGVGTGFDMFDSVWAQRMAVDIGTILSYEDTEQGLREWGKFGGFGQAAIRMFSSVVEDSKRFRELKGKVERYQQILLEKQVSSTATGTTATIDFGRIRGEDRGKICDRIQTVPEYEKWLDPAVVQKIRDGESLETTIIQTEFLQRMVWDWFSDEKFNLEQDFGEHVRNFRWYLGGSIYAINTGEDFKFQWDVATFVEQVDKWAAYVVLAKRDDYTLLAGADFQLNRDWTLGIIGAWNVSEKDEGAGALSLRWRVGPGTLGGMGFMRTFDPPIYARPGVAEYTSAGQLDIGGLLFYTIGIDTTGRSFLAPVQPTGGPPMPDVWGRRGE
ncbi:MAG: hypothetical protein ABID61_04995 [Candidatus Micrarchaeota archaeon]